MTKLKLLTLAAVVALACAALGIQSAGAASPGKPAPAAKLSVKTRVGSQAGPLVVRIKAAPFAKVSLRLDGHLVPDAFEAAGPRAQVAELRAEQGLHPGPNTLRITTGQGSSARTATRRVTIPPSVLLADAGGDADATTSSGSHVGVVPLPGDSGTGVRYRWRIADAPKDAEASLTDPTSARPALDAKTPGTYVLEEEVQPEDGGRSSFDQVTVAVSPNDPPIGAPINTSDPGRNGAIVIAGVPYGESTKGEASAGTSAYVVLERTTRAVVDSGTIVDNADGVAKLAALSAKYSAGANFMRYMMIVSGRYGLRSAQGEVGKFMRSIGATHLSEENFLALRSGLPYSVIGIPGAPEGAATVRIPGGYANPVPGAITGYLQKNQAVDADGTPLYDFVAPEHPSFDTSVSHTATSNTMTIAGQSYSGSLPAEATAGLHVVVLESLTLRPLENLVLKTNSSQPGNDRLWQSQAAAALEKAIEKPGGPTVFVQTIGKPKAAGPEWNGVVEALHRLGANRQYVNALDGTTEYALVARLHGEAPAAESSTAFDQGPYPAPKLAPARLVGLLSRTRTSTFEATLATTPSDENPNGTVNLGLVSLAYQSAQAWPQLAPGAPAGEAAAAQTYICQALKFCQAQNSCAELRECFWAKYGTDWEAKLGVLNALKFPTQQQGFGEKTFDAVREELAKEMGAVAEVKHYLAELQAPLDKSATRSYVDLQDIGQKVWESVQRPPGDNRPSWILGLVSEIASLGEFAPAPASSAASGLSAAFSLAAYLANQEGQPILGSEIKVQASLLASKMLDRIDLARAEMAGLGMLIVSDYGKLTDADKHIASDWALASNPATTEAALRTGSRQWFYETLVPTAYPYLIRLNAYNARSADCRSASYPGWPNQPDSDQMLATVGYDGSGNPIKAIFFFTRGYGRSSSPPASLGDAMFRPRGPEADAGLGIDKLQFFNPGNFGGTLLHAVDGKEYCELGWLPREP